MNLDILRDTADRINPNAIGVAIAVLLLWVALRLAQRWVRRRKVTGDDMLTVVAAAVAAAFSAQGMWGFFRATLHLPVTLTALGFTLFELVQLVCALRARRSMREHGHTGAEGTVLWLSAGAAGFFSATHAQSWAEALFRLLVPSIAAWLWHRLMKLEHRRTTGRLAGINWRLTPERVLIKLGLADPTDRTAAEVSAERTVMTLAISARKARTAPDNWRGKRARKRLDAALQRAVEYGRLGTDPASELLLVNTLGVLNGADSLKALQPPPPWTTTAATAGLENAYRDLIGAGMVEVNDRTRAVLGLSATTAPELQPGWLPSRPLMIGKATQGALPDGAVNQAGNHATSDTTAGQDPEVELTATIRATIIAAAANNVSERDIAQQVGISRDRVRAVLGRPRRGRRFRATKPQPASVNGHHPDGAGQ